MEENTMRYNSSRNRITRSLGVLVGAALVAALMLPSVAQAQEAPDTPVAPRVAHDGTRDRLTVTTRSPILNLHDYMFFNLVDPDGVTIKRATIKDTAPALAYNLDGSSHHGTWKANLRSAMLMVDIEITPVGRNTAGAVMVVDAEGVAVVPATWVKLPLSSTNRVTAASPDRTYTHGPPEAPANFDYDVPSAGAHLFSWTNPASDYGLSGHRLEWTKDDPASANAEWERAKAGEDLAISRSRGTGTYTLSAADLKKVDEGVEYTFRLRALGISSADNKDIGNDGKVEGGGSDLTLMLGGEASSGGRHRHRHRHSRSGRRCSSRCSSWAAARICSGAGSRAA